MNDHHVYDWIDETDIPKGTNIETSRWCDSTKLSNEMNSIKARHH